MINISEHTHNDLYYDVPQCIEFCKNIKNSETDWEKIETPVLFHMFWNVGKEFGRKQMLPVKSFLATQNLEKTKLIVWSNIDLSENVFLQPYLHLIELRIYDPISEAKNTVLENKTNLLQCNDDKNWAAGDLFRILVLHKYGGVYVDFDVVFLRDFAPLLEQEFMYKWSFQPTMINGAVIRMFKDSNLSHDLLRTIRVSGAAPGSLIWSSVLYENVRETNKEWTIFPCGFFNTEWQIKLTDQQKESKEFKDLYDFIRYPFKKNKFSNEMYEGCFSWHWHNQWDEPIEQGSKWQLLEEKMEQILKAKNIL